MQNSNIEISVIIPVYNVENYIYESLSSVAKQTFTQYELIVINDGSTDRSEKIIKEFMNEHKQMQIHYIYQENNGQSSARNRGIEVASGEYIYFFDSDDLIEENALEILYMKSNENNLDLLLFSGQSFYETQNAQTLKYKFDYLKKESYPIVLSGKEMFVKLLENDDYSTSPCLYFVRKSVLREKKLYFYEGIIHEDALFTFQLILSVDRTMVINDILFRRRVRLNSTMTANNHLKKFQGLTRVLIEMDMFKQKIEIENMQLEYAIQNRMADAFGNSINQYIYLEKEEQNKFINQIALINSIAVENNFFKRKDYWLFTKSPSLYSSVRKTFDYLKLRKDK